MSARGRGPNCDRARVVMAVVAAPIAGGDARALSAGLLPGLCANGMASAAPDGVQGLVRRVSRVADGRR